MHKSRELFAEKEKGSYRSKSGNRCGDQAERPTVPASKGKLGLVPQWPDLSIVS